MFDLRKIEAFCKVCEHKSFSKAGEALFLSQPTVSAHIQSLERDFEVRLLDRMGRTVLPTPAGAVLYRYAKQAFSRLEAAKAEISALAMEVTGDLFIGSSSIPAHHVLPAVLASFTEIHPKVRPSLMVASSASIFRHVQEGDLMAGIVGIDGFHDSDIVSVPVFQSEIIVIAPSSLGVLPTCAPTQSDTLMDPAFDQPPVEDPLTSPLPEITFETACSLQWILREESSATRRCFENAVASAGNNIRLMEPRLVVDSSHAAVQYVQAGLGVSIAARIAIQRELERGDIKAYRLSGVHAVRHFSCIMNSRRIPFPAATVFQEFFSKRTAYLRSDEEDNHEFL